ncbi:Imm26 family immunity protein [Massilia sp. DJPM01]|uniref:Imm26 family immunity protein n=1 Tax=Massilia sp. DJPM01 TaxID=3024404 RepID=UPI00259D83EA|nr:Imm26 family immunity protein [Massilia sp. DJPM01]MDM5181658.1 Imm26 family immunity protein [Massilia sp. DJPM01]
MGWWSAPDNPEVTVGDAVLDSVRHFLRDFSREYQEDLSRKPTLQELEYALNLAFKVNVDSAILDGVDELEVKQVALKTAKRPTKHKVTPGDIFAYRLEDGRFGFGRVVAAASVGAFAEIFDYFAEQPVFDYTKIDTWLVPPVPIESYSLLEMRSIGDWRLAHYRPHAGLCAGSEIQGLALCLWFQPEHADVEEYGRQVGTNHPGRGGRTAALRRPGRLSVRAAPRQPRSTAQTS